MWSRCGQKLFRLSKSYLRTVPLICAESLDSQKTLTVIGTNKYPLMKRKCHSVPQRPTGKLQKVMLPTKSENDTREYRSLFLENGLRVLLISDLNGQAASEIDEDEETEDESGSESGSESDGHPSDEEMDDDMEDDRPGNSKPPSEKKSAVALCIGVGSFSDPDDIPGFAHFLEHMVFMGSEKYPKENELDDFLGRHGGFSNAWTDCEKTCFYFDVERKYFRRALDMFAHFFISPLFREDCVDREIEAVDSEFQMNLPNDDDRINTLFGTLSKPGHPMSKFFTGNAETLRTIPKQNGINVYSRLRDFYTRMYSSHYMTVAIQSKDSLDKLEEWSREIFSAVPHNDLPQPVFHDLKEPFDTTNFRKMYRVVPVEDAHKVYVNWALPPCLDKYRTKPLDYLTTVLADEGEGSILAYLKEKLWALSIVGGYSYDGFEMNSTTTSFCVVVTLTDVGLKHYEEVVEMIFQYIHMLEEVGPQKSLYQELKQIEESKFRWKELGDPLNYVEKVSENMQMFPWEDVLTGRTLMYDYDPKMISDCLAHLTPDKCNIMLMSDTFENTDLCPLEERWYKTKYGVYDLSSDFIQRLKDCGCNPALHLPRPNAFIATDFDLRKHEDNSKYPKLLKSDENGKFWFKPDTKFKVPKGYNYIHLMSPVVYRSLDSAILLDFFVNLLEHQLTLVAYPAYLAGFEYGVEGHETGILLYMSGFSHKMKAITDLLLDRVFGFRCTRNEFKMMKEEVTRIYNNDMIRPDKLARMLRFAVTSPLNWPIPDRLGRINDITHDMFERFVEEFQQNVWVESFLTGNFSEEEAAGYKDKINAVLPGAPLPVTQLVQKKLYEVPVGNTYCQVKGYNYDDNNSCVVVYLQSEPGRIYTNTINEVLGTRMTEPCFDFLRTKHQLGYSTFCEYLLTNGILGLAVTVECQANKFSMSAVDKHIDDFLVEFRSILDSMTEEEFKSLVDSIIAGKRCEDTHLGEEAGRNWREIYDQTYIFDIIEREIKILPTLTLDILKDWYLQYEKGRHRKISFQIVGKTEDDKPSSSDTVDRPKEKAAVMGNTYPLTCLVDEDQSHAAPITDIKLYKQTLNVLPFTKIIS
ncbi:nardilysin-like [Mizuhopecten yessoensis]|uniref:Nardilysin n=1 Tax=Mizuhopecten yessoensis TaxID=6573 RepID=A0A210PRJ3_MIZYE|nr:nardilysin-like [Mizuhopecten yessoensis]OWF39127.1 Nardilysin [Mizuhopecten yessoensis]